MPIRAGAPPSDPGLALLTLSTSSIIDAFPAPALLLDSGGTLQRANQAARSMVDRLPPQTLNDLADAVRNGQPRQERLEVPGPGSNLQFQLTLLPTADGSVLVLARDATLERNLTKALIESRQLFRDLVACSADFAWETRADGSFAYVSPRGALDYTAAELAGEPAARLRAEPTDDDADRPWPFDCRERLDGVEVWLKRKDGGVRCFEVSCMPVMGDGGAWAGARGVAHDVTELREARERLERLSRTDDLTGLMNRRAFVDALQRRLRHLQRHGRSGALLFVDLDNFKTVNDSRGHAAGDDLLRRIGAHLIAAIRAGDLAARLGGDEFALWLEEVDAAGASAKAESLRRLGQSLNREFGTQGRPFGFSIGTALSGPSDNEAAALIARADAAMYAAKHARRSGIGLPPTPVPQATVASSSRAGR